MKTKRVGSYSSAVHWLAFNDDNDWIDDENGSPSVSASLVADVFGRTTDEVTADLRKLIDRDRRAQEQLAETRRAIRNSIAESECRR